MWFFALCRLFNHYVPTVEGVVTDVLLWLALGVLTLLIVYGWLHLRKVWEGLRKLLHAITLLPVEEAFTHIPAAVTSMFGPDLTSERPGRQGHLHHQLEQHKLLATEYQNIAASLAKGEDPIVPPDALANAMQPCPNDAKASRRMIATANACLLLLRQIWDNPRLTERFLSKPTGETAEVVSAAADSGSVITKTVSTEPPGGKSTMTIVEKIHPSKPDDDDKAVRRWLARVEDFVALEVTFYLSQFFVQLRNMALFLSLAPLLLLLAVTSYPLQPQRLWVLLAVALIGLVTLSVIWIVIQIERNELVSRILKTTPNQINFHWGFLSHLAIYALPLLGILVAMSSDLSDLVHAWVDPLLEVMR